MKQNLHRDDGSTLPAISASVAQSDTHPIGDQEVMGLIPARSGNFISWRLIMKYFYNHSLPSAASRKAVVSFLRKNVHKYRLTA